MRLGRRWALRERSSSRPRASRRASTHTGSTRASAASSPVRSLLSSPGAPASAAPKPRVRRGGALPGRSGPRSDGASRQRPGEGVLRGTDRDCRAPPRMPEPWRSPARSGPWLRRRVGRPGAARTPGASSRRRGVGCCRRRPGHGAEALAQAGSSRSGCGRRRGVAHQRHAVHERDRLPAASCALGALPGPRTSRARSPSRRSRLLGSASGRRSRRSDRFEGSRSRPRTSCDSWMAPRSSSPTAGATRCRTRTPSAAPPRFTVPVVISSRTRSKLSKSN